jgi:hypothetical protein
MYYLSGTNNNTYYKLIILYISLINSIKVKENSL